jgi:tRNA G18 (ribose-2'-O)-methylase SpoU
LLKVETTLYVADAELMRQIVGFDFHRGVLALGRRAPFPSALTFTTSLAAQSATLKLVACPSTETAENLGLIFRSAKAFGIDGVLLPESGADPLSLLEAKHGKRIVTAHRAIERPVG